MIALLTGSVELEAWRLVAWIVGFGVAVWLYTRATPHCRTRFIASLWVGVLLAHLGPGLLQSASPLNGHSLHDASILFFPLGVLAIAPFREALASLPLAFAVARLGCLPYDCCYETPYAILFESFAFVVLHFMAANSRYSTALVLAGFGSIRLIAELSGLRVDDERWPSVMSLFWIAAGFLLQNRIGSADSAREWFTERTQPLLRSLALMLFLWLLFPLLGHLLPADLAVVTASVLAATIVLVTRPPKLPQGARSASYATLGLVVGAGAALVWARLPFSSMTAQSLPTLGAGAAFAVIVLVPVFEEVLYRRRLLDDLRTLWGTAPAILLSSILFALAHLEPRAMVIPFLGGLVSAMLTLRTDSLGPSIGLHMGWNAATLAISESGSPIPS